MPDYFGNDLSAQQYELLRIQLVDPKLSDLEPALFGTKWWDYRILHPMQATYLFAHEYRRARRAGLKRRIEYWAAVNAPVFGKHKVEQENGKEKSVAIEDFTDGSKTLITGLIKARQMADRHGIPYYSYCRAAVRYAEDMLWTYVPKPHQMYANQKRKDINGEPIEPILASVIRQWEESKRSNPKLANDEFYLADNYCQHPFQEAHKQEAMKIIRRSPVPVVVAAELTYERRLLKPEWLKQENQDLFRQATQFHYDSQGENYDQLYSNGLEDPQEAECEQH